MLLEAVGITPATVAIIVGGLAIASFAKGITGFGLPLIAVPIMGAFLGVERAVVIMSIPAFATNLFLLWEHRRLARRTPYVLALSITGGVGIAAGAVLLTVSDSRLLSLLLACVVFGYVALRARQPEFRLSATVARRSAPGVGAIAGVLQGAVGISGPVLVPYLHSLGQGREAFVFSLNAIFQIFAVVQVSAFAVLGLYDAQRLAQSALAMLPIIVVLPIAVRLARRIPVAIFERVLLGVLLLVGLRLLLDGLGVALAA